MKAEQRVEALEAKLRKKYPSICSSQEASLIDCKNFVEDIIRELVRLKRLSVKDPIGALLVAALHIFNDMSDETKGNVFIYLLGRARRKS